jgi:hypothetical protein
MQGLRTSRTASEGDEMRARIGFLQLIVSIAVDVVRRQGEPGNDVAPRLSAVVLGALAGLVLTAAPAAALGPSGYGVLPS